MQTRIEIIIPTTGTTERRQSLFDAIDSVRDQEDVDAVPLVILNGTIFDLAIFKALEFRDDILFHYQEEGCLPKAIRTGRGLVEADFFGFLDDDDILLRGALALKLSEFQQYPNTDVVAGNGYIERFGPNELMHDSLCSSCQANPLFALLDSNWLASCGGLFKTVSVDESYFVDLPKYYEWSWVAFNLALDGKHIRFVDVPTFRVKDSAESLSKEMENVEAFVGLISRMLDRSKGSGIYKHLKTRLGVAYHSAADQALQNGFKRAAWNYHLRSLNTVKNFKYLGFTRHLL
jgi:hypothetical protein